MSGPWVFDQRIADRAVEFFPRFLRHTKGEWAGRPFELADWQAEHTRQIFGWRRRDNGRRRYRAARIWVPRKNGKTLWVAGVGHLLTVGDGEPGAEVYSHAVDKAQAAISYDMGASMVALSRELTELYEVTKTAMFCPHTMSTWRALSGEAYGKHGLSAHGLLGDEAHEWRDDRLHTFLRQSMGARRQPLDVIISTAGNREGYGWELYQESAKILDGVLDDEETYVAIYEAGEKDDWQDEDIWRKANPNLGVSLSIDYMRSEAKKAMESPRIENDFRRYHLNQWVSQATRWLPMDHWRACTLDPDDRDRWKVLEAQLKGRPCYAGLDLASTSDTTAMVLLFPAADGLPLTVLCRFWVPRAAVALRSRRDRLPYEEWERSGALIVTEGNVTDYAFVREQIFRDCAAFQVQQLGIDPFNATHLANELIGEGVPVVFVRQGYLTLSAPSKELERLVLSQAMEHGSHPVLEWHAENAAIQTDPAGNIKPAKNASADKIDGIAALVDALALTMVREEEKLDLVTSEVLLARGGVL